LGDIQHDGPEASNEEANHGDGSNNIQATIKGMQRQIDQLTRGSA